MTENFTAVEAGTATPPYEQLKAQIIEGVREGRLAAGHKLPTVRALATELGLAANTVARAYRDLEHEQVIVTRGRMGSFVAASGDATRQRAQEAAALYAARIHELHLDAETGLHLVRRALGLPS